MKNDGNDVTNTCLAGAALYNLEYVEQKQQSEEKRSPAQAVTIPKRPSLQPAPAAAPAQPGTRPGGQPRAHLMAQRPCRWPALLLCSETRQAMRAPPRPAAERGSSSARRRAPRVDGPAADTANTDKVLDGVGKDGGGRHVEVSKAQELERV